MARELRRLLIDPARLAVAGGSDPATAATDSASLLEPSAAERHYLQRVLRMRGGDRVAVIDGCGGLWTAALLDDGRLRFEQPLADPLQRLPPSRPLLRLALGLPRRDGELVWRMATELGLDAFQPLQAERCVPAGPPPLDRWRAVVTEACEQCERLWLPQFEAPQPALRWLAQAPTGRDQRAMAACDPEGPQSQAPSRQQHAGATAAPPLGAALLATTSLPRSPLLADALTALPADLEAVTVAIGPEGGWSAREEELAIGAGWRPVSLGSLILRSGTAAVAAAAQLVAWRQARHPAEAPLRP